MMLDNNSSPSGIFGGRWPFLLLGLFIIETVALGIAPASRTVWLAENLTALIPVAGLCLLYRCGVRFSNTAYSLMALFFFLHVIGGHYTFEYVPFGFVTDFFGFSRNHFDRVCHFLVGTFAFAALEYFDRSKLVTRRAGATLLAVMAIFGFSAVFEVMEWLYAEFSAPESGAAFLGSQGDVWDAQKDMLADGLGAMFFSALYAGLR